MGQGPLFHRESALELGCLDEVCFRDHCAGVRADLVEKVNRGRVG